MLRFIFGFSLLAILYGCGGEEGDAAASSPAPAAPPAVNAAPSVSGTPATLTWADDPYVFQPSATDPDGEVLTFEVVNCPPWASLDPATGRLQGVPTALDVGTYRGIGIRVSDGLDESWLPRFDITVEPVSHGAVTLTWTPPARNIDDSPLEDLAGFTIYWGTDPDELVHATNVDAGISSHFLDGLSPGRYYFATTARNALGIESNRSDFAFVVVR